ncbi:MAG: ATP-grasp domain-containing protein [Planctomycetota bacterium]|nr:ATP-grasp domain-containing protein [Planctomycetota bacterium]
MPESLYIDEYSACLNAGFRVNLIDFDALVSGDIPRALGSIATKSTAQPAIYRGWMLTLAQYEALYQGLLAKGIGLMTSPGQYAHCHHFPNAYPIIENWSPRSIWLEKEGGFSPERVVHACRAFGEKPIVIKDYVKSQKHYWKEACFVPCANDSEALDKVMRRFIELQGESLAGGLVFREFVPLKELGVHPQSGMPMSREFRIFFFNRAPISILKYWDDAADPELGPPRDLFLAVAAQIDSAFFSMDVAQTVGGDWLILEIGDGQVSGFSEAVDLPLFYSKLAAGFAKRD